MKRAAMYFLLTLLAFTLSGCTSLHAQCAGGRCNMGLYSPWAGFYYYYNTRCVQGRCAAKPKPEPKPEPAQENESLEPIPAEPADETPEIAEPEPKPFCVQTLELINSHRRALGLAALRLDTSLCSGCDRHSAWMASGGGLQHGYFGGRECIAMGVRSPQAVVNLWLNSSGHRAIILGSGRIAGVGVYGGYWTLRVR